jgi:hypothetical protein
MAPDLLDVGILLADLNLLGIGECPVVVSGIALVLDLARGWESVAVVAFPSKLSARSS